MENKRIIIQIRGNPDDDERLRLYDFINQLDAIRTTLNHLEDELRTSESAPIQYRVVDLSHQSPATVVLEAVPGNKGQDVSSLVIDRFMETIKTIKAGRTMPDYLSTQDLEPFKRIGPPPAKRKTAQRHLSLVTIKTNSDQVDVAESLEPDIEKIVGPDQIELGSVYGMLELINIHASVNTFRIYPIIGPRRIDCHFRKDQLHKAISGVGRYIQVHGELRYKHRDKFPYAMDAIEIDLLPDEDKLPSMLDLKGVAPNATGDLKSEDFVRRLRDEGW